MLHAVIMAGGIGARFWPLSRKSKPKQLVDLLGNGPMIEQTINRTSPLVAQDQQWIVTNREQMLMIRDAMPSFPEKQFILEPMGKNTAPAIGLAAVRLLRVDPDAVMAVLPADHLIDDVEAFRSCLMRAVSVVAESDALATIGIEPTRPETGYGYIQIDNSAVPLIDGIFKVKTFAEKPNLQTAKLFLESGEFLWNSGIFVWRADTILKQIADNIPRWHAGLKEITEALGTPEEEAVIRHVFSSRKGISIDYGVMEHARHVAVVRATFGWSDVGSWDEVWRILPHDEQGNACQGNVLAVESKNNLLQVGQKLVALVNVDNLIVIETDDALLICPRDKSQSVRAIVDALEKSGKEKYL
jgi:mannose-1-phosphate guanylyltransferase